MARNVISLDQAEVERGPAFRRHYQAQLAGFEMAQKLATGDEVVTEAALRELHRVTCAGHGTHRVLTAIGVQERALALGSYKSDPNHVQLGDGSFHSYAPVGRVPDEMHRLVTEMRSTAFLDAPAVVQAAFAHHALTAVHPFADGNGRVARLVASVWLVRAVSIPLWVEPTDRDRYLDVLGQADSGDRAAFVGLVTSVTLRLLREVTLVLSVPWEAAEQDPEDRAAERAAERLAFEASTAVGADAHATVTHPHGYMTLADPPAGVTIASGKAAVMVNVASGVWDRGARSLAVGVDRGSDELSRFCVLVYVGGGYSWNLVLREDFEADELMLEITPSASRRLADIARLVVESSRAEHRARGADPS
ncbi:Fic family protein [Iamia sp.]|uniref:Fic family protein n=1 Tax=Iamia sp. TaxID=2722710 RepID=UPI002D7F86A2|nr:Fic family protein [Iamia sp.]